MEQHVAEQRQAGVEILAQHLQGDERVVRIGVGAERAADEIDRILDLLGGA
jgi:hypothetical protein